MKPSGQPRLHPATIGGVTGGTVAIAILVVFATAIFPPLGLVAGGVAVTVGLVKWSNRRQRVCGEKSHRRRMDAFYQAQEDARREEYYAQRTFVNPGWQV